MSVIFQKKLILLFFNYLNYGSCDSSLLQTSLFANATVETNYEQSNCICVPFWQCKEDFSGLIEDGVDIMDVRALKDDDDPFDTNCTEDFDVCCQIECGKLNNGLKGNSDGVDFRILDGNLDASFGEFPWMLGILEDRVFKCGGALIHPSVAISAAHCVSKRKKYKIRAGEWNWASSDEPFKHQDQYSKKIIIHPNYHHPSLSNDVALIILDRPFKLTGHIGVICIPPQGKYNSNKNCIASGWGKTSYRKGEFQSTLKKVQLPMVPKKKCLYQLQKAKLGPQFQLHDSFVCAGGNRKDACKGDGGSPLICPIDGYPDRFEQVGIVSWGLTCGLHNTPGVYVNVALFSDWIDQEMIKNHFDTTIYRILE